MIYLRSKFDIMIFNIFFSFQAKRNFRDLIFDLTYGTKATDRVLFSAKLAPNKLAADLKMLGNEARVRLERAANKVKAEGAFNQDKMTIGVEYQLLPGDYFVNVDLTSTLVSIRDVKLNLIHKLKKQPTIELHSMVRLHLSIYTLIRSLPLNFSFLHI